MDPISNPYTPGPGVPPFELPGRAGPRQAVHIGIERARRGLSFASVLVVGLLGVGKTVLLTHMRREAENAGALSVHVEGSSRRFVLPQLASDLRLLLVQLQESRGKGSAPTANSPLDYQTASHVQRP